MPFDQARAYAVLGFLEEGSGASWLSEKIAEPTYWINEVQLAAQSRFNRERNARYWFRLFCQETDLDVAWCNFRLFLACVDRRCWLWVKEELDARPLDSNKLRFFNLNRKTIQRRSEENEKVLKETYIGCKVDTGLYPWMRLN